MSMRPPPEPEQAPMEKKRHLKISDLVDVKRPPVYCLCYSCQEVYINDTIFNTLLCPGCPATMPMMNFVEFDRAQTECARAVKIKQMQKDQFGGSPG